VWDIFNAQLQMVAAHDHGALTLGAVIGVLIALWSARLTMSALMTATNIAYEVPETRGFFFQLFISLVLTFAAIAGFLAMLLVGIVIPLALAVLGTSSWVQEGVTTARWLLLWLFAGTGLGLLYHYAPARRGARRHWITWGSALTATFWLLLGGLFGIYVRSFANYDQTYGALTGMVVLLMWFYLLSYSAILGVELDAAVEARRIDPSAAYG
jgi:membrane protein